MNRPFELKIQVRAKDLPGSPGLPWADLENMPDFHSYGEAHQWLIDSKAMELVKFGLDFRIVPKDLPCTYNAALEKNLAKGGNDVQL